ncbi:NlpC/P60 family protein [Salsuginibacillus kocurii]|uniref:NlpC/P60 family protein n=1 Tax=Salsuginibacillus kocurii TaxID=427078 RepID=UPI0003747314|nr:NlpC/P60 family protein [Salsuginibacillus kocurii]
MKQKLIVALSALLIIPLFFQTEEASASTSQTVIDAGKSQLGTPYQWGGTTPSGFDCSGFTRYAFQQAGISLPRTASQQYQVGSPVSRSNLQPGDLVFFSTTSSDASHNGIYIGGNQFIHSSSSRGVSIASLGNTYWSPRYLGARRVIEDNSVSASQTSGQPVEVTINGQALATDQDALLNGGRTVVPMRAIFEELGATVTWNQATKAVRATKGNRVLSLTVGNNVAYTATTSVQLDQPAKVLDGRTMVPLRVVSESMGANVNWNSNTRTVEITY